MASGTRPTAPAASVMLKWPSYALGVLHQDSRATLEHALAEIGLSLREYSTLAHIDELRSASQRDVAARGRIDSSDLVKVLDRLQARRLITRERDPADRRRHLLTLTPAGREAVGAGTAASERATSIAFAALSADELSTLHRLALKAIDPRLRAEVTPARTPDVASIDAEGFDADDGLTGSV